MAPQRWECGYMEAKDMRSHIRTSEKLCNDYPSEALANDCSNSRSSSHGLKAAFLSAFIYHNESG